MRDEDGKHCACCSCFTCKPLTGEEGAELASKIKMAADAGDVARGEAHRLRGLWEALRADVEEMRSAQRPSPGGQQAGTPHWPRLPPSLIVALDRYCRRALDKK